MAKNFKVGPTPSIKVILKLNTDANVRRNKASGAILGDSRGNLVAAFYKEFGDLDVLLAESCSLLFAIQLCLRDDFYNVMLEIDYKV